MKTFVGTHEPVMFTFVLFNPRGKSKWFEYYRDSTVAFVKRMAEYWPSSIFWGHVGEHVDNRSLEMMFDAVGQCKQTGHSRIRFTRYTISERPDKHWLVAAMRLPVLWEHKGPETVISIDIHDDIKVSKTRRFRCSMHCMHCVHCVYYDVRGSFVFFHAFVLFVLTHIALIAYPFPPHFFCFCAGTKSTN